MTSQEFFQQLDARIRNGDAPYHDRMKIRRPADQIHITRLETDFLRNSGMVRRREQG